LGTVDRLGGRGRWAAALVAAAAVVPYLRVLPAWFVADDFVFADWYRHSQTPPLQFLWRAFTENHEIPAAFYRPLPFVMLWAETRLFDGSVVVHHLVNILIHAATSLLVWRAAMRWVSGPNAALASAAAAVFFAAFPRRVEAVAWLSCRPDLVAALLALVALSWWMRGDGQQDWRWRLAGLGCWGLSLLSKETAIVLPVALLVMPARRDDRGLLERAWRLWPFAAGILGYLVIRRAALGVWVGGYGADAITPGLDTLASLPKFLVYAVLPPIEFLNRALLQPGVNRATTVAMASLALALAVWIVRGWRDPAVRLGTALTAAAVLPVVTLPPSLTTTFNDRLLYLPSVGVALMAAGLLSHCHRRALRLSAVALAGAVVMTAVHAERWRTAGDLTRTLVADVQRELRAAPPDARLYLATMPDSLGGAYMLRSRLPQALHLLGTSGEDASRVVPLTLYLMPPSLAMPVEVTQVRPGWLTLRGVDGRGEVVLGVPEAQAYVDAFVPEVRDRFGRHVRVGLRLRQPGRVFVLAPDGMRPVR
jgi:hypothetical protein